jgi:hypothetical protein
MWTKTNALVATILCVSACFVHAATSAEEFCDEVKKALSSSNKFSEWRGTVIRERNWVSLYSLPGFDECHIFQLVAGSFNLRCVRGWWLDLKPASFDYDQLRKVVEECLPTPNWVKIPFGYLSPTRYTMRAPNNPSKLHRQLRGRILRALNLSAYPSLIFDGCEAAAFRRPGPSRTRPRASSSGIVPVKHCLTSITRRSPAADPRRSCSQRTRPGGSRPNFARLPDLLRKP